MRNPSGRFEKGFSGNPSGRKPIPPEIKEAFVELVPEALEKLKYLLQNTQDEKLRLDCINVILNRVYGKPSQELNENIKMLEMPNIIITK